MPSHWASSIAEKGSTKSYWNRYGGSIIVDFLSHAEANSVFVDGSEYRDQKQAKLRTPLNSKGEINHCFTSTTIFYELFFSSNNVVLFCETLSYLHVMRGNKYIPSIINQYYLGGHVSF